MRIVELSGEHEAYFLSMLRDYRVNDKPTFERLYGLKGEWNAKEFQKFVKQCEKEKQDWRPKAGKISITHFCLLDDEDRPMANGILRFPLDARSEVDGGNLSCDVPPALRRKGLGSYCLALLLFEAVRAGLRRVLVTCPDADLIARKVIEKNRGVLQDIVPSNDPSREGVPIRRYWISFQ